MATAPTPAATPAAKPEVPKAEKVLTAKDIQGQYLRANTGMLTDPMTAQVFTTEPKKVREATDWLADQVNAGKATLGED